MKKDTLAFLWTALLAFSLSAAEPADPHKKTIGVSLLTRDQFYLDMEAAIKAEAEAQGFKTVIYSADLDAAKQTRQIEDLVTLKVDALVVCPVSSETVGKNLAVAEKAGIPVFTADIRAFGGTIVSHIASDNIQGGRLAAQAMAKLLGGKGRILVIDHPEVSSVADRVKGFEEELKKSPGLAVVAKQAAKGTRSIARSVMEDMLIRHPDLSGVFCINDNTALGALSAVEKSGRKDIVIIGYDATPEAQEAIQRGSALKADAIQHPAEIGKATVRTIASHLKGEKVPAVIPVDVGLFPSDVLSQK